MSELNIVYRGSQNIPLSHAQLNTNFLELYNKKVFRAGTVALFTTGSTNLPGGTADTVNGNIRINTTNNKMEWFRNILGNTGWEQHNSVGYRGSAAAGYNGSVGVIGTLGYTGSIGYTGSKGLAGYTGSKGVTGAQGPVGPPGPNGINGYTGSKGAVGWTGPPGTTGYTGSAVANASLWNQPTVSRGTSSINWKSLRFGTDSAEPGVNNTLVGLNVSGLGHITSSVSNATYPNLSLHRSDYSYGVFNPVMHFVIGNTGITRSGFVFNAVTDPISGAYIDGFVGINSGTITFYETSDYRRKTNLKLETSLLTTLSKVNVYNFNYIGSQLRYTGFIAHEIQEYFPIAVTGKKDDVDEEGNPIYQKMDTKKLIPVIVAAVNELTIKFERIKSWLK